MATEQWVGSVSGGAGLTWTAAFGTEFTTTALGIAASIASSVVITNGSFLDVFCDFSFHLAALTVPAGSGFMGVYLYPANQGGIYGDGRFGAAATAIPPSAYNIGNVGVNPSGTSIVQDGVLVGFTIPPGSFKFVLYNGTGVATAASGNLAHYRTYNISVN